MPGAITDIPGEAKGGIVGKTTFAISVENQGETTGGI